MIDQQEANASIIVVSKIKNSTISTNNPVYLVRIEDPFPKPKERQFLALRKPDNLGSQVSFQGFEIHTKNANTDDIKTREDALKLAEKNKSRLIDIQFSWSRVISVQNLSYQNQNQKSV